MAPAAPAGLDRRPAGPGLACVSTSRNHPGDRGPGELRHLRAHLGQLPGAVPASDAAPAAAVPRGRSGAARADPAVARPDPTHCAALPGGAGRRVVVAADLAAPVPG